MENRIMKTERPQKGKMSVLEEISRIITGSRRPEDALNKIVVLVAGKFSTDVCSVYLLDKEKNHLVLRATVGLRKETVGKIRMGINEGLTGLVLENMKPVFVVDPSAHPRYRFFKESGEGLYTTFLGVPLVSPGPSLEHSLFKPLKRMPSPNPISVCLQP
jgi:signal transduction protein with GAF and PtsI domain